MEKKLSASLSGRRLAPLPECLPYLALFPVCYAWVPAWVRFTKRKKEYLADGGAYVLMRLPGRGSVIDQDAFTLQTLSHLALLLSEARRPKFS